MNYCARLVAKLQMLVPTDPMRNDLGLFSNVEACGCVRIAVDCSLDDAQVQGVLFPLLAHATDPSLPESEVLIEEALRLWRAVLGATDQIPFEFANLMPNLWRILERGKDNAAAYAVIEALLLGGVADMKAVCGHIVFVCMRDSVKSIAQSVEDAGISFLSVTLTSCVEQELVAAYYLIDPWTGCTWQACSSMHCLQVLIPTAHGHPHAKLCRASRNMASDIRLPTPDLAASSRF